MNVSLEYLRSVLERRRMFNCVPVIITYDNFSRFFPSPYPSFLSLSLPRTSLFPCFHTGTLTRAIVRVRRAEQSVE